MFVNMTKKVNWNCLNIQENKLSILLIEIMQQQGGNLEESLLKKILIGIK